MCVDLEGASAHQNYLQSCKNPHYLELWINGRRYAAEWSKVNMALIDRDAIVPIWEVPFPRVQCKGKPVSDELDSPSVHEEQDQISEEAATVLTGAAALAEKRIREKFPDFGKKSRRLRKAMK